MPEVFRGADNTDNLFVLVHVYFWCLIMCLSVSILCLSTCLLLVLLLACLVACLLDSFLVYILAYIHACLHLLACPSVCVCVCLSVCQLVLSSVFFQFVSFVGSPVVVSIYVSIDDFLSVSLFFCLFVACNAGVLLG